MDLKNFDNQLKKTIENFKSQMASLRTNRASPSLIEDILVEYYNTKMPLKSLALINVSPPNVLMVQPYDLMSIDAIVKAIQASPLGVQPAKEGNLIRIVLPPLTEERRRELTKIVSQKQEETRINIKKAREELMKEVEEAFDQKEISEDQKFHLKEEAQKLVTETNKIIDELAAKKEEEIMSL